MQKNKGKNAKRGVKVKSKEKKSKATLWKIKDKKTINYTMILARNHYAK